MHDHNFFILLSNWNFNISVTFDIIVKRVLLSVIPAINFSDVGGNPTTKNAWLAWQENGHAYQLAPFSNGSISYTCDGAELWRTNTLNLNHWVDMTGKDWNDFTVSGTYQVNGGTNRPTGLDSWGVLTVLIGTYYMNQLFIATYAKNNYQGAIRSTSDSGAHWTAWHYF